MSHFQESSIISHYQFPRWSTTLTRPHSSLPSKDALNDMRQLGIDSRHPPQRPESSSAPRITEHHVHIPTASRLVSPPIVNQPNSPADTNTPLQASSPLPPVNSRLYRTLPVRIKSSSLIIPVSLDREEFSIQNFPKQTHEQRKLTHERRRRKQQAQTLAEKYAETETWFQLRQSLAELKRLATTEDIFVAPNRAFFNCDGHSFTTLKPVVNEQQEDKKVAVFKSESGLSSCFGSSSRDLTRTSLTTSQSSFSRPRTAKLSTETYHRSVFDPLLVASKPIHLTSTYNPPFKIRTKSSVKGRPRPPPNSVTPTAALPDEKRAQLLISDLSNDDNARLSSTPSPPMIKPEQESSSRKIVTPFPTRLRPPSNMQMTSTIKLKSSTPRCRSATEIKPSYSTTKQPVRFILIADQEHRIESWYHQYPFILSDDLLTAFQSDDKSPISAYFTDDVKPSNPHATTKTFLQGKPFHIRNDWKKYDLIFISNNIYEQIITYLQTIVNLLKSSGKIIQIYQINHQEDLKKQVRLICKQLQQQ